MRNMWMKAAAIVMATGSGFAGQAAPKNVENQTAEVAATQEEFAESVSQDSEGEVTYQEFQEPVKEPAAPRKSAAQKAREAEEAYYK